MADESLVDRAVRDFNEHGYAVVERYLDADDLRPAQDDLSLLFPTGEEYHAGTSPERNARFAAGAFSGIDLFPYASVAWSLLGVSPKVVHLAETLLGTSDIRLYESHNWAKYGGATEYDQALHRDFGNHMMVVPSDDPQFAAIEMFIYIHDVSLDAGPTHVVSQVHTHDIPMERQRFVRGEDDNDALYALEVPAAGPAGSVLLYRPDVVHRGSTMTDPQGARFVLKASYHSGSDVWCDKLFLSKQLGPAWHAFVASATPRQLELTGFPARSSAYWTTATWTATSARYPDADLSAFAPT